MANDTKTSAQLEMEVEAQRNRLEDRVTEIQERLSPGQLVDELLGYAKKSGGTEFVAKLRILDRGQRGQHGPLFEQLALDVLDPGQPLQRRWQVVGGDEGSGRTQLVNEQLEPQLGHLVLDDEQHLVVVSRHRVLGAEQMVQIQVASIGLLRP